MLFNSLEFIFVFLPVTVCCYFFSAEILNDRVAKFSLVSASFFFYSFWNPPYIALLALSISTNYLLSLLILKLSNTTKKKQVLILAIALNLTLIGYYKYLFKK